MNDEEIVTAYKIKDFLTELGLNYEDYIELFDDIPYTYSEIKNSTREELEALRQLNDIFKYNNTTEGIIYELNNINGITVKKMKWYENIYYTIYYKIKKTLKKNIKK